MCSKKRKKPKTTINLLEDVYNKIRQVWTINPKTRVKPKRKKYNRSAEKRKLQKENNND